MWGAVIDGVTQLFTSRSKRKAAETEAKHAARLALIAAKSQYRVAKLNAQSAAAEHKAERMKIALEGNVAYDLQAQRAMQGSWKDEFVLLVMLFPFVGGFIPGLAPYIDAGWVALSDAPAWYPYIVLSLVFAIYGLTRFLPYIFKLLGNKK